MKTLENQDIVCIAGVDFEPLWARTQQLMWRFPETNRILYVEAPLSFLSPVKDPTLGYKWHSWLQGVRQIKPNLFLFSPPLLLPFANRYRLINKINQFIMAIELKRVCKKLGFKTPILLTYLPNTADMVGKLKEKLLVYDCVDEHSAFQGFDPQTVMDLEKDLLYKADLVFVTAQPLMETKRLYTRNIIMLRNAADVNHFKQAINPELPVPEDIADLPSPVLGFVGRIKEWIDLELIKKVAQKRPEWNIVMVGPVEIDADINIFKQIKNIRFVGARPKEALPAYLKKFDVCLNPFRPGSLSFAVNPLKFYEYLAAGKPIVSTPMPEMEMLSEVVEIGEGVDGFIRAIEIALQDTPDKMRARLKLADEHSWERRVKVMCEEMAKYISS